MTLEELKERKAARAAEAAKTRAAREAEVLELEERMIGELGGDRGVAFEIIDVIGEPLIVVKAGPSVLLKQLQDSKMGLDDQQRFVTPCVVTPDKTVFGGIVERRAAVVARCCEALITLYRGEEVAEGKKF